MIWAVLTVIFEFAIGIAEGHSIAELLAAYNPLTGNLWLLVLATTLFSPVVAKTNTTLQISEEQATLSNNYHPRNSG